MAASVGIALDAGDFWQLPIPDQGEPPALAVELTKPLDATACGLCHVRQFEEWRGSLHAEALGPGLLGQLPAMSAADAAHCLSCHAPRVEQQRHILSAPMQATPEQEAPEHALLVQASAGAGGVDCAGCHVRAHRRYGPNDKSETLHGAVTGLPLFRQSDFCAPCHQFPEGVGVLAGKPLENTHEEWAGSRHARAGVGCQDCHMPGGSHAFRGIHDPATARRALRIELMRVADGVRLLVRNTGAGHAVPTYATPRIRLQLQAADNPADRVEHLIQRTLALDPDLGLIEEADTRLMPDQAVTLSLSLAPAQGATARILVEPDAFYQEVVYPAVLGDLTSDDQFFARRLLQQARAASSASPYVLYRAACGAWMEAETTCASHPAPKPQTAKAVPPLPARIDRP